MEEQGEQKEQKSQQESKEGSPQNSKRQKSRKSDSRQSMRDSVSLNQQKELEQSGRRVTSAFGRFEIDLRKTPEEIIEKLVTDFDKIDEKILASCLHGYEFLVFDKAFEKVKHLLKVKMFQNFAL